MIIEHFHVWQKARGSKNHQQIGHSVATHAQATARVKEFREHLKGYYTVTHSGACHCSDSGPIDREE